MKRIRLIQLSCFLLYVVEKIQGFAIKRSSHCKKYNNIILSSENNDSSSGGSYGTSDASSKRFVSSLTGMVNFIMGFVDSKEQEVMQSPTSVLENTSMTSPTSPLELMRYIENDYVEHNYLWTGNIYLPAFEKDCKFTDPTLSFIGTDRFVSNVKNLVPIVNILSQDGSNQSDLLEIQLNEEKRYIQTRWNMIGDLYTLPWKPAIDVIGRTKFWYRESNDSDGGKVYRVFSYDEEWEVEASYALLQLITPKGSIPNSNKIISK